MLQEMMRPRLKGQTIEISLSKWGYDGYIVECTYYYNKQKGKYSLSLWLSRRDMEDRMKLYSKKAVVRNQRNHCGEYMSSGTSSRHRCR